MTTLKLTAKPNIWKAIGQGEELTYTFTIINGGQPTATGITLTEQWPAGTTLVSLSNLRGLDQVKDHGIIFFSTDASPYDDADMETLAARLKTQQVKFNAVVSGDCGDKDSWNEVK